MNDVAMNRERAPQRFAMTGSDGDDGRLRADASLVYRLAKRPVDSGTARLRARYGRKQREREGNRSQDVRA